MNALYTAAVVILHKEGIQPLTNGTSHGDVV